MSRPTVAVAMSGGVDSSVTCMLLIEQGFRVFGITMKILGTHVTSCPYSAYYPAVEEEAREVCRKLGVPHHTVDLTEEFEAEIITPFIENYSEGKTPNPCVLCNRKFKFGHLLTKARDLGADYLATGHYARAGRILEQTGEFAENHVNAAADPDAGSTSGEPVSEADAVPPSRYLLARGKDPGKDQSYVLYGLSQHMLSHAMFPLGSLTKEQVVAISRRRELVAAEKPESQEICFVGTGSYQDFLRHRNVDAPPGNIVDTSGKVVGRHKGLAYYTVGQRRGLGISGPHSFYVVNIDPDANEVIVGKREEAYAKGCYIGDVNFIMSDYPESPVRGTCMVRYRGREVKATLIPGGANRPGEGTRVGLRVSPAPKSGHESTHGAGNSGGAVLVEFDEPQFAVTSGQALVFYQGAFVYGGGTITKSVR